jgi:outer membrane protein assembly factor BamB
MDPNLKLRPGLRWWPAGFFLLAVAAAVWWVQQQTDWSFQQRNIGRVAVVVVGGLLLLVWWIAFSRAGWKTRVVVLGVILLGLGLVVGAFRIRGVSGDVLPILEPRWVKHDKRPFAPSPSATNQVAAVRSAPDFPQFLGPGRNAVLDGPALDRAWDKHPPQVLWRQPVGAAWSGFAIVGGRALTQEQRGDQECVTCYEALTGRPLWSHSDPARYFTTLAGEGPRCTPTVVSNRVFTLGATGLLNCLELETGRLLWAHNIVLDASSHIPEWGFSGSPLVFEGCVMVSAGGSNDRSLLAYRADNGQLLWSAGSRPANYSSPFLATLCGCRQILVFNTRMINAHDADSGKVLWEYPWGIGQPQVAEPVIAGTNRVLFSSGYGVGSELLQIDYTNGAWSASRVWQSRRMKAKFANLVQRDGFLYGLDDGVLACLDLKDGSQKWKEGRYGHGQGLLIQDLFLLMAEAGELVLLQPQPDAPHELHRFRVFESKTWNPIALSGDLLLVRNDREAAALKLALDKPPASSGPER